MHNQQGRDNKMYYVSDGFNLDTSHENQFTSLLTLSNIASARSQLTNIQSPHVLPNIKSQTLA